MHQKLTISLATNADREDIYRIRHEIYARELHQHPCNDAGLLRDALDEHNIYIVARSGNAVSGFISITPPEAGAYSVDKYFRRDEIGLPFDEGLFEVRLLSIVPGRRNRFAAAALLYAAYRWLQAQGAHTIIAICRIELLDMYRKAGLLPQGKQVRSGMVTYELCKASLTGLQEIADGNRMFYEKLEARINWRLPISYYTPAACYHGGSFFEAIGEDLDHPERRHRIINADVLDAWYPPAPEVIDRISTELPWLLQTSPPTHAGGLLRAISRRRGIPEKCLLAGAGSSDIIFRTFLYWLRPGMRVLITDPCYGEYDHILSKLIGCQLCYFELRPENGYRISTNEFLQVATDGWDLVVLVNPNSPTGVHLSPTELKKILKAIPETTRVWIDETYVDYAGNGASLEAFAATSMNVVVCKSMSKVYALSGARVAYLCAPPHLVEGLRPQWPPWAVSLPAQMAAIAALEADDYYKEKINETHKLREWLSQALQLLRFSIASESIANFVLTNLPPRVDKKKFLDECRASGLFLRDVSNMGPGLPQNCIRIAVKDAATQKRMIDIIKTALTLFETTEKAGFQVI